MSSPVEPKLFDFFDDFATEVTSGEIESGAMVVESSAIITFCENFFAQFFENFLKKPISGFGPDAKRTAARIALGMRGGRSATRALVTLFEGFCDVHADVIAGSYGAEEITYVDFHEKYVTRLLGRVVQWAAACKLDELKARVEQAQATYQAAIDARHW